MSRRGRACAANIVPTSTGAANAIGKVIPELNGLLEGIAYRVPVMDGSMIELTFISKRMTSVEEINHIIELHTSDTLKLLMIQLYQVILLEKCWSFSRWSTYKCNDNLVKVTAWYDNEYGYTSQMLRTAKSMFK